MTFKEAMYDDMRSEGGFFDLDEFASEHVIDGVTVNCIVQNVSVQEATVIYGLMKATLNPKERAAAKTDMVIHIREEDVRKKITPNSKIMVDGNRLFVRDVRKMPGCLRIQVGWVSV